MYIRCNTTTIRLRAVWRRHAATNERRGTGDDIESQVSRSCDIHSTGRSGIESLTAQSTGSRPTTVNKFTTTVTQLPTSKRHVVPPRFQFLQRIYTHGAALKCAVVRASYLLQNVRTIDCHFSLRLGLYSSLQDWPKTNLYFRPKMKVCLYSISQSINQIESITRPTS